MSGQSNGGQSLGAKQAEVQGGFFGSHILTEPSLGSLFRARATKMLGDLRELETRGVAFGPFLEIGAGCVQRSEAVIHYSGADGVATDLNHGSLRNAPYVLSLLGYSRLPLLICCDAQRLPFLPNTFQFVFTFQTLHRFEDPNWAVAECYRVLGKGGCFFFDEEPMGSLLRRLLRGKRMLSDPPTTFQRLGYRLGLEKVFWDDGAWDRSRGITVARFDIELWRHALRPFSGGVSVEVNRRLGIQTDLRRRTPGYLLANLVGGNVRGLCRKAEGEAPAGELRHRLMCVDCNAPGIAWTPETDLCCPECGRVYPSIDGVIRMLPKDLETKLYS